MDYEDEDVEVSVMAATVQITMSDVLICALLPLQGLLHGCHEAVEGMMVNLACQSVYRNEQQVLKAEAKRNKKAAQQMVKSLKM